MTFACPPSETLRRLGADSLSPDDYRELEAHLEACAGCRDRLQRLARLDTTEAAAEDLPTEPEIVPEIPGFLLGRELGRGGSGVVYEAFQPTLRRKVAVKVLSVGPAAADARRRWLREARAIARVPHPNIVRLHDVGEHDGRLFLVLDLIAGGSLRDRAAGRPIPARAAALIVQAVARAVEEIHGAGLLHLDVKPSNILMAGPPDADWADLTPMLSDFGIARDESDAARDALISGTLGARGTPAFMAPEQVTGLPGEIGPPADVHALGATLYSLLTGRPPFLASSPIETMDLLRSADPPSPRALTPGVPRDLETICLKALQKAPARRYASAAALADDLARFREGRPIQARPVSAAGRLVRWGRRHPVSAALSAALLTTILAALVSLTALWRRSEAALARAVQGEAAADGTVTVLLTLLRGAVESPEQFSSQRRADATAALLDLTAKLRRAPSLTMSHALAVADLEVKLARLRRRDGYEADAIRPLDDADALLAFVADRAGPGDDRFRVDIRRVEVAILIADGRINTGAVEEATADLLIAERIIAPYRNDPRALDVSAFLRNLRARLAHRIPGFPPPSPPGDDPLLQLADELDRCEDAWPARPSTAAWEAYERLPTGTRLPRCVEAQFHRVVGRDLSTAAEADVQAASPFDPQAVARRVLAAMDDQTARLRIDWDGFDEVVERLSQYAVLQIVAARRAGRIEEVRRGIAWTTVVGRELARRAPRASAPHLMIARAHEQEAKLAWLPPVDRKIVERSLHAALDEAAIAQALEPDRDEVRRSLAGLREKYLRLLADEPDPVTPPADAPIPPRPAS